MPDNSLPDELISEILWPALKISDNVFSNTSHVSPFSSYGESTSAYLLVCKSWLRVATPLLYSVVVLRSKAQAKALAAALSGNPQLGRFIKKLRVEGGFGPSMQTVLRCSPNITDLFLTLEIFSSDHTGGLCKGLSFINPSRLILQNFRRKALDNKMVSQMLEALAKASSKWNNLVVFDCPFQGAYGAAARTLLPAITARKLHTLTIQSIWDASWAWSAFKTCPLEVIRVKFPFDSTHLDDMLNKDPKLLSLLKYTEELEPEHQFQALEPVLEHPLIAPSLDPFFIPLANAPKEVRDEIWARILWFATPSGSRKLALLLVSKTFYRLALPFYYEQVVIRGAHQLSLMSSIMARKTTLGPRIRTLTLAGGAYDDSADFEKSSEVKSPKADAIVAIFSRTNNLVEFGNGTSFTESSALIHMGHCISWDAFETLAACSGSTLRKFLGHIQPREPDVSPTVFNNLQALQTLWWRCRVKFSDVIGVSAHALPSLEVLRISFADPSFLSVLIEMQLPSLRHVILPDPFMNQEIFFMTHGFKMTELSLLDGVFESLGVKLFEFCPNLSILMLSDKFAIKPPNFEHLHPPHKVPSLVEIVFQAQHWISTKESESRWHTFFTNFNPQYLSGLRDMRFNCYAWPTNERDIAKSYWVRWAEVMLSQGVSLIDKKGSKWRPRLKIR
ncbi:F-box domain-containing protein [Favolaschia claudopus]|uniref:F-box domain-containing protein n=1 Tax=Favolaschia claudopus TaxID=2862362 RepID=A0AAW0BFI6_9AGAR